MTCRTSKLSFFEYQSPIDRKTKELSGNDKAKIITLSILVGFFTLGVGGILLSFRLRDYFVKKQIKNLKDLSSVETAAARKINNLATNTLNVEAPVSSYDKLLAIMDVGDRSYFIRRCNEIPSDRINMITEAIQPTHLIEISVPNLAEFILFLGHPRFSKEEINDILRNIAPFISKIKSSSALITLMEKLIDIPQDRRESFAQFILELFEKSGNIEAAVFSSVINAAFKVPPDRFADIIQVVNSIHLQDYYEYDYDKFFQTIVEMPTQECENTFKFISPLFERFKSNPEREVIITAVSKIPQKNERGSHLQHLLPLLEPLSAEQCAQLIGVFSKTVSYHDAINNTRRLDKNNYVTQRYIFLLKILTLMPYESEKIKDVVGSIQILEKKYDSYKKECLTILKLIAPEDRLTVLQELISDQFIQLNRRYLLRAAISHQTEIHTRSLNYLTILLNGCLHEPKKSLKLASKIFENAQKLMLNEQDALYQLAIEVKAKSIAPESRDYDEFYVFYEHRQFNTTHPPIEVEVEKMEIEEETVAIDIKTLREKEKKIFTFGDLPQEVKPDCIDTLFKSFDQRIQQLSSKQQEEILTYIEKSYEISYSLLKEKTINNNSHVFNYYLTYKGDSQTPIAKNIFYLYQILRVLLKANQKTDGRLLSEQEEMLFAMSSSITNCQTGQKDGIDLYFKNISLKIGLNYEGSDSDTLITNSVNKIVNETLNSVFASEQFLKDVSGRETIIEESHQTLYLKNRFYKQVGLNHTLTFDKYVSVVNYNIRKKEANEVLKIFFFTL